MAWRGHPLRHRWELHWSVVPEETSFGAVSSPGGGAEPGTRLSYLLVLHYAFRASALSLAKLWSLLGLCPQW